MSRFHSLRIADIRHETRDALVLTLHPAPEQRDLFQFTPGQHLTLRANVAGEEIRRSYSICSAPFERQLRIAIKRVPDGVFSCWAHQELRPGHTIECMEPAGDFRVAPAPECARGYVAFAAGSGITPVLSIVKTTLREEPMSRWTLVYGNRGSSSVMFRDELADLKDLYLERLNLVFVLSREQQDVELFNGRIDRQKCDGLLRQWIDPEGIDVAYLCGPQSMMEGVSASLRAHGLPKERIRMELFGTGPREPRRVSTQAATTEQHTRVTVVQDGRRREFFFLRGTSTLLESALHQGIELPYACKGGVCSTCRCKLTRGEVETDANFALEDYEVARGFILTCQSYPLTQEITLDFDQES